jgi:outer membrane beta-barrel protein
MKQEKTLSSSDIIQTVFRRLISVAAVALIAGIGSPAAAQSGSSTDESSDVTAQADASGSSSDESEKQGPDPDDPDYWAKVRKIHTVQKREYQKVGRLGVSAYAGIIPNNIFERYFPVGLRLNYYILENIGLELSGSRSFRSETSLEGVMDEDQGINSESVRVADTQFWHANFGLTWSPFYGKTSFYENSIGYFDMFLFGGMGMVVTKTPEVPNQPLSEVPYNIKPEGVLGAGVSFFLLDNAMIRADFRQFIFQKAGDVGGVANPSEVSLGFGWFF